ncbi:hypothetical protein ACET3Z_006256 [Daucus carota]
MRFWIFTVCILASVLVSSAELCGKQAGNALCPNGMCCSQYRWCGTTAEYCTNCQSQCGGSKPVPSGGSGGVGSIITETVFSDMFKHRNDGNCRSNGFYTYSAFINGAQSFNGFGTTGTTDQRKQELAAFLAQTSHETTGGWATAPDGCNYNYGQAGRAIGVDLINNPDLVATDAVISFKTAIWFWMTPQSNKPSSHDVITGRWSPSAEDIAANHVPGFGVITNIINGGLKCNRGTDSRVEDRIGFYKRYCDILGVGYGIILIVIVKGHLLDLFVPNFS